jgi:hypothetical protein
MLRLIGSQVVVLLVAGAAAAATITVRKDGTGDFAVLQQGLDAAAAGDTILIGPGEYTESSLVRLRGYSWDVETYGLVRVPDLTIIGSGRGATLIGSPTYRGSSSTVSPKCLAYDLDTDSIRISQLTLRGCYGGIYVAGTLYMDDCHLLDNALGVSWFHCGSGGWIKNTRVEIVSAILYTGSFDIGNGSSGDVLLEGCYFADPGALRSLQNAVMRDCDFRGFGLYSGGKAYLSNCRVLPGANVSVSMTWGSGAYCEITDSVLGGAHAALVVQPDAPGGRYVVTNSTIDAGAHGVLHSRSGAGACVINGCDLSRGSGPMVECDPSPTLVEHDLRNNYWGTTDAALIESWIIDRNDNPNIGATVLYTPFAGQTVPTETRSWGDVKALWRDGSR